MDKLHSPHVHASGRLVQNNHIRPGSKFSGYNGLLNISSGKALNADIQVHGLDVKVPHTALTVVLNGLWL